MSDLPSIPGSDDVPTPRWVKVLGIAAVVFVLAFVVLHLSARGFGHHMAAGHGASSHGPEQP
ncbi:MAG TPA: hypothetical protein VHW23_09595 [Kofleriaceae bacterium]|nr:hypothetical protein [Kofleriaceae bacterium]